MTTRHPWQPTFTRLEITEIEPRADADGAAGLAFRVAYDLRWPATPPLPCRWRLDLALFEIDLVDPKQTAGDRTARPPDDEVAYASLTEKGHRILGPDATASVLLELQPGDDSMEQPLTRSGRTTLFATQAAIDEARAKGELPALDWDGDVYEDLDFDPIIKARGVLRPIEPGPVTAWSGEV